MKLIISNIFFICVLCLSTNLSYSQVEVRSTSPNSVLDINSPNKGVLLPRINDTSLVNSPQEGLIVYNKASKTPSYHDGTQWNNMSAAMMPPAPTGEDSLTYTVLNNNGGLIYSGTRPLLSFDIGGSSGSEIYVTFQKPTDINTIGFLTAFHNEISSNNLSIEIKVYIKGQNNPYLSYKITDLNFSSSSIGNTKNSFSVGEIYNLIPNVFCYKEYSSGLSYAYNQTTNMEVTY